jgi:predicted RNA-binding Zn ribbon-like protein
MDSSTELIRDFVNTLHKDPRGDEESLVAPEDLAEWLNGRGLLAEKRATPAELRRAVELREAFRQLLLTNNGEQLDVHPACTVLSGITRRGKVELEFTNAIPALVPAATGVDGALGALVVAMQQSVAAGTWHRLKACRARDCEWAFIDEAKNNSRAWCSMSSCGNREKARKFRERHAVVTASRAST